MTNFLNWNDIHIPGFYIKHGEHFRRIFIVSSRPCISRKATSIEVQTAVTNSSCFTLNSLNTSPVINNQIVFVTVTKR